MTKDTIFLNGTTSPSNSSLKGGLSPPMNYHPISLLNVLSKILSSIMVSLMNDHFETKKASKNKQVSSKVKDA